MIIWIYTVRMYPSLDEIREYLKNDASKPFLLVEYCHSMGNGPGDFEDYFELIHKNDLMCGGFVWEWCDHAIYKGTAKNGKAMYYYGGDHGEKVHDLNFCMDGWYIRTEDHIQVCLNIRMFTDLQG